MKWQCIWYIIGVPAIGSTASRETPVNSFSGFTLIWFVLMGPSEVHAVWLDLIVYLFISQNFGSAISWHRYTASWTQAERWSSLYSNPTGGRVITVQTLLLSLCPPGKAAKCCDKHVCALAYLKIEISKLYEIFRTCYLFSCLGPSLTTVEYVMYFRFCGWRRVYP